MIFAVRQTQKVEEIAYVTIQDTESAACSLGAVPFLLQRNLLSWPTYLCQSWWQRQGQSRRSCQNTQNITIYPSVLLSQQVGDAEAWKVQEPIVKTESEIESMAICRPTGASSNTRFLLTIEGSTLVSRAVPSLQAISQLSIPAREKTWIPEPSKRMISVSGSKIIVSERGKKQSAMLVYISKDGKLTQLSNRPLEFDGLAILTTPLYALGLGEREVYLFSYAPTLCARCGNSCPFLWQEPVLLHFPLLPRLDHGAHNTTAKAL